MSFLTKRNALLILLAVTFFEGMAFTLIDARFGEHSQIAISFQLLCLLVNIILLMRWFVLDAKEHNYRISGPMYLMLVAITILAAPFYFFATRGKRALGAIARALGFFLLILLSSGLGGMVAAVVGVFIR